MDGTSTREQPRGPSRALQRGILAFLAVFVAFGLIGLEAWPLTAWRLFSVRRNETLTELQAWAVSEDGDEQKIDFIDLPMSYRHADRPVFEL